MKQILFTMAAATILLLTPSVNAFSQQESTFKFIGDGEKAALPDLKTIGRLRFLTSTDFPPFNFIDQDGRLTGFQVDLAREICETLQIQDRCEIQALPFDQLQSTLLAGQGEAMMAGIQPTSENRTKLGFSAGFLRLPARFISQRQSSRAKTTARTNIVGVVDGSAHHAYVKAFFPNEKSQAFTSRSSMLNTLKIGRIDTVFDDAMTLSFWLAGSDSNDCCEFTEGAYFSDRYFGEGLRIAFAKNNKNIGDLLNNALHTISRNGKFEELLLRHFPVKFF